MGLTMPGMVTPSFNVEAIEKKINELKSVENWMQVNLNVLKMTIQGLEVQKATLSALNNFNKTVKASPKEASSSADKKESQVQSSTENENSSAEKSSKARKHSKKSDSEK